MQELILYSGKILGLVETSILKRGHPEIMKSGGRYICWS